MLPGKPLGLFLNLFLRGLKSNAFMALDGDSGALNLSYGPISHTDVQLSPAV